MSNKRRLADDMEEMKRTLQSHGDMLRQLLDQEWIVSRTSKRSRTEASQASPLSEDTSDNASDQILQVLQRSSSGDKLPRTAEVRKMGDGELRLLWEQIGSLGKLRKNASIATMRRTIIGHLNNRSSV